MYCICILFTDITLTAFHEVNGAEVVGVESAFDVPCGLCGLLALSFPVLLDPSSKYKG
jgi:hypothetical protein